MAMFVHSFFTGLDFYREVFQGTGVNDDVRNSSGWHSVRQTALNQLAYRFVQTGLL